MHKVCNVCMPQAICDIISSIGIGAAAADSIGYRAPAQYRSNPNPFNGLFSRTTWVSRHQKGKPFWILLEQEMMGRHWHQSTYLHE